MADSQTKAAEEAAKKTTDDIARDLEALRGDLSRLTDSVRAILGEEAESVRSQLHERADHMARKGRAYRDAAVDELNTYEREAEAAIHRNPFTAVLVALGLGLVLGIITRGR